MCAIYIRRQRNILAESRKERYYSTDDKRYISDDFSTYQCQSISISNALVRDSQIVPIDNRSEYSRFDHLAMRFP